MERDKLGRFLKGQHSNPQTEFKKNNTINKGKKWSKEYREKINEIKPWDNENSKKTRFKKGHIGYKPNLGKKFPYKPRPKMKGKSAWNKGLKGYRHSGSFKKGHKGYTYWKGKKLSEETKIKLSLLNKGKIPWNKGLKGFKHSGTFKKGHKVPKKWREKYSKIHKGKRYSIRTEFQKGKHYNPKTEFPKGEKHPNWMGGISFEPYPIIWNEELKRKIRQRDKYICQICKGKGWCVHHIDYLKDNCIPENLITLCRKCHQKTNNNREYWLRYFLGNLSKPLKVENILIIEK